MDQGRLNDIFNDASEAVIVFDSQGSLLYINNAAQHLFHYTYSELEQKSLPELIDEDIREEIRAYMQENTPHARHVMEQKAFVLPKQQQPIPANLLFSSIAYNSRNIHMLVIEPLFHNDIHISTDYRMLADSLPETVSLYNQDYQCLYVNPSVRELYHYRPAEYQLMGGFFGLIAEEDRSALLEQMEEDRQKQISTGSYTYQAYTSRGDLRQVEMNLRRVFDEQGQLTKLIIFEKIPDEAPPQTPDKHKGTAAATPVPMMLLDANWQLTYMNEAAAAVTGQASAAELAFFDLLHADDRIHALTEKQGYIQNGIISTGRYLRLRSPEGFSQFRVVFDKFFDEHGQTAYITVRLYPPDRQDHTQLGSSRYLKLMSEHVDEVVCFFRQDYNLDYVSPSVKQALGYDSEALQGNSLFELIHPEDREEARAFLQQAPNNKLHSFSCRFQNSDGSYLRLELDLRMLEAPPEDDRILPFLALLRHMPQLSNMTDPVTLFSRLSDHLTDALAVIALPSLRIEQANRHLLEIFGSPEDKLKGENISVLFEPSTELNDLEQAFLNSDTSFHQDIRCILQQEEPFWANVAVSFLRKKEQKYAIMRITDISEQKEREEKLQQARQEAEQTLKSREEFLSTMSHEIRTPLNAILGMTHLMLQGKPREDQVKLLQTLKFSGDSLTALINDVLDFSKIDAGKLEFVRDDFNLREFLHNIKQTYKTLSQQKGLIFRTLLEEELPEVVNGDVTRLGQILNNLLNNAIKFTEDGYVILSIYMEAEEDDHYVLLFEVTDTGIGIPQDKQPIIFDPYQQASERTSRYFGGTGLGLSIVKKLVDLSNGEITLQSDEGKGTNFKIRLKFAKPSNVHQAVESGDRSFIHEFQPLDGLKVLYVEDVIPNQFLMEGLCDTWHIELDTALSGLEALEKVKKDHYDLILMDIYMPGMSGFEAAQEIRKLQDPHYSKVPIIALSASISERTQKRIIEKGMNDYIAKPINPRILHQKLSQYARVSQAAVAEGGEMPWEDDIPLETIQPDIPDFEQLRELYDEDPEGYVTILKQIHRLSEESSNTIREALHHGQQKTFRSSAHKIMSYVRLMKLQGLQELLDKIKGHFEDHSLAPQAATNMLEKHFSHFMAILDKEIRKYS